MISIYIYIYKEGERDYIIWYHWALLQYSYYSDICYSFPWNEKSEGGVLFFIPWKTRSSVFFRLRDGLIDKCLMCHGPVIAPTSFVLQKYIGGSASHGAAKHIPQGFGGCRVFATHFPEMKNERGGSCFSFHGKHAVVFFQFVGWPRVLDV